MKMSALKKKDTARVELTASTPSDTEPKTIKLKRPGGAISVNPRQDKSFQKIVEHVKKSETSRVELPADIKATAKSATRVKIKRPKTKLNAALAKPAQPKPISARSLSEKSSPEKASVAKRVPAAADVALLNINKPVPQEESTIIFSLIGLVAAIIIVALLYFLLGQTFVTSIPMPSLS
ncbi:MAG: hypothetical protein EOL87_05455 [Spartobacteria bacterium]|nr:hypothetical protein [Spartobacteria bacterium]